MKCTILASAMFAAFATANAEVLVDFELSSGYVPASSFITPGEPGAVDGWFLVGDGQLPPGFLIFGSNGARITPDPVAPLLGGSGTLSILKGVQSAAVTTDGALLGRQFDAETKVNGNMTLSFYTLLAQGIPQTGIGIPGLFPLTEREVGEFRYSDNLKVSPALFPAGVRISRQSPRANGNLASVQVLTANQTWRDTGVLALYNHLQKIEIVLNAGNNTYRVFITDLTAQENPVRASVGTFPANGRINGDAGAIKANGGVVLASQGGTAVFDEIEVIAQ